MGPLHVLLLCPLRVLLLWALLCPGTGNVPSVQEEIFTRPGSDLLLPIRRHLTLTHPDTKRCDGIVWRFTDPTEYYGTTIFIHRGCTLRKYENALFPNMKISENGSLIISNVTPENDRIYRVDIYNSTGDIIQKDYYSVHVEVPVSVPLLHVSCLRNGSAEISCRVEAGTKPNIRLSVIGGSQERYSASANNITAIVGSPGPWNIACTVENGVSRSEESRAGVTCPVPLSDITVTSSCLPDGSAVAECSVKGSDPRYSWSLDGRSVSSHSRVTLPPPVSGTLRCDVTNQINHLSRSINIFCPVPVSDPVLDVKCLQNGSAEISCSVEKGNDPSIYLTVIGELEVYDVTGSERTVRVTVPPVSPPDSWNISCSAKNDISERSTNQTQDACPGKIRSLLGHLLSPIAVFVLYTALLIFMVNDLRKMKNEKNLSERRMRRRDQVEMEMEPTYYNDRN
ncbi:uncharacterized protein LOC120921619 isoform X2 [Rana temporaria]|uniref:uncharacterized protein LOC120921619 isoform X2 n=1 Tax=Rana temporaria TaxID=8407 RepID=UPI001AAD4E64|nr:uncharacterized protein LOC120921619 isoform X2 [Rana temporaria]